MGVSDPKKSLDVVLLQTIIEKDVQAAIAQYKDLKANKFDEYNFKESQLNAIGYTLLQAGKTKDAIEILKLNVESFPSSSNVYDSMGEACMIDGNKELAIENYNKSLELDPGNKNAEEMLKKLETDK
ncbi:MAG: hypothetical protein SGI89_13215 [bacterium]|nr:hypothetical protein [bacterium]